MTHFSKYQGVGNDFVVVQRDRVADRSLPSLARQLSPRRVAIGSDGLLVLASAGDGALSFQMFNPDGSEDMCGNGLRCSVLWAYRAGLVAPGQTMVVHGFDRDRKAWLESVSTDARKAIVSVEMGTADFTLPNIPFAGPATEEFPPCTTLEIAGQAIQFYPVSTGSTHAIVFGEAPVENALFEELSPLIENHSWFPNRTSIMWTSPRDGGYTVRIWERAAGETLGCGTGATAIAAAAWASGRSTREQTVAVVSKGGQLDFRIAPDDTITMSGPAEWVFDGDISL